MGSTAAEVHVPDPPGSSSTPSGESTRRSCSKCLGRMSSFSLHVTSPLHESRLHWIHDPNPNQSHRVKPKQTVPRNNNDTVPRNNHNTVPRNNNVVRNSDSLSRNPLEPIPSTSQYNSSLSIPSAFSPRNSVSAHSHSVPRINNENTSTNKVSDNAKCSSPPSKKGRSRKGRIERRARERENRKFFYS